MSLYFLSEQTWKVLCYGYCRIIKHYHFTSGWSKPAMAIPRLTRTWNLLFLKSSITSDLFPEYISSSSKFPERRYLARKSSIIKFQICNGYRSALNCNRRRLLSCPESASWTHQPPPLYKVLFSNLAAKSLLLVISSAVVYRNIIQLGSRNRIILCLGKIAEVDKFLDRHTLP